MASKRGPPGEPATQEFADGAEPNAVVEGRNADVLGDPSQRKAARLVVGIGASAGGLDAFRAFFTSMPADSGMVFILVQHLDPTHVSSLVEILASFTSMVVRVAEDGVAVAPDVVYVIPPDAILTITGGVLRLKRPAPAVARRNSINVFLTSLAQDQGEWAVGIILSGLGSDGGLGMAAIKERGGLTISQAEFDHHAMKGMPQNAASGGFVDYVLAVEDIPATLLRHRDVGSISTSDPDTRDLDQELAPPAMVPPGVTRQDGIHHDLAHHLLAICAILNRRLGRDFSRYKSGILMRRIQRRMHVLQTPDAIAYLEQLRSGPNEAELLFREMLIGVTRFFRDTEAFAVIGNAVLPALLANPSAEPIRVWVAGCATGEEAYSLAILLREGLMHAGRQRPVQIFATDVDDRAIAVARAGLYPDTIAADVSQERLDRYFVHEDGAFRIAKSVREMCLFSNHDLTKDPPFSRLDFVSCRNLLIYFEPDLQQQVLTTLHFALRPGGQLFLGPSETVSAQSSLFAPFDKRHRVFVRLDAPASFPVFARAAGLGGLAPVRAAALRNAEDVDRRASLVMAQYAPAFMVVDESHTVLRFSGQLTPYLDPATGTASLNLFRLLHVEVRDIVLAALRQAAATAGSTRRDGLSVVSVGQRRTFDLIIEPLSSAEEGAGLFVVAFRQVGEPDTAALATVADGTPDPALLTLRQELQNTRDRLGKATENLKAANEELQSSNEEYLSVNEELQSTNEELETSKEELQSLNEELQTINAELNDRNDSLVRANSDLLNLFDSTSIATLFLDNDLRIRRFTPRLLEIFKVREGDEGRPISDIVSLLTRNGLAEDVRRVLQTLTPVIREVAVADGASYEMQVRPYRGLNNTIDGAVATFIDISERKSHEQVRSRLAAIVESSRDAIISLDLDGIVISWNAGASDLFKIPAQEAVGGSLAVLLGRMLPANWAVLLTRLRDGERIAVVDISGTARDGRAIEAAAQMSPVREADGRVVGASFLARDITEHRAAERKAAMLLGELDHRVKNILAVVSAVVSQTLKNSPGPEDFAAEVEDRVQAIATAHSLLTRSGRGSLSLRAILTTELAPYDRGDGNVALSGRDVDLPPDAALAVAMAIHELASNAAKYGALSTHAGRLAVGWEMAGLPHDLLTFVWTESGGPEVRPPTRRGFGTTLIERTLTHQFDAEVSRQFLPEGVRCTITMAISPEAFGQAADLAFGGGSLPDQGLARQDDHTGEPS